MEMELTSSAFKDGAIHRRFFCVYAMDTLVNLRPRVRPAELARAMKGHILAEGQLTGKYER